jgi:hypothetical protein
MPGRAGTIPTLADGGSSAKRSSEMVLQVFYPAS